MSRRVLSSLHSLSLPSLDVHWLPVCLIVSPGNRTLVNYCLFKVKFYQRFSFVVIYIFIWVAGKTGQLEALDVQCCTEPLSAHSAILPCNVLLLRLE